MNNHMYEHAATRANLATLRERGVTVIDPGVGALGSKGRVGRRRLAEPPDLLRAVEAVLPGGAPHLVGLRVLVTAGGTREPIDSVRFVGNRSSGRMGFALAEEAAALGAAVTVDRRERRPRAQPAHPLRRRRDRRRAQGRVRGASSPAADVLLMAAAVADYRPAEAARDEAQEGPTARRSR